MCGLAGLFLPTSAPPTQANLQAMLAVMRHRGPDGTGSHVSDDHRFQAGFARLAIIDLATSDQPLVEDGGRRVLLGNGEIYNYRELRRELERRGHVFATHGDMEPALKLWSEKGEGFVHDLNGMYGLALYDRVAHSLLLVRDRLGIKPLYWAWTVSGGIVFASEVKALFASGLIRPEIDDSMVTTWMAHGYVPAPATLYKGVFKIPPGCLLRATASGNVSVERYWDARPGLIPHDPDAIRSHLTELLTDAVRMQLRSDVPLAALLSGGLDSGLLVALAAGQMDQPLSTFTVRFSGASVDESPLAASVAQRYGTNHHVFDLSVDQVSQHLPKLAWYADEPLADASLLPNYLIDLVLAKNTRVVLNGTGGDELFAGYGRYFKLPVEDRYTKFPRIIRRGLIEPVVERLSPMTAWRLRRAAKFDDDRGGYLHDHSTLFPLPIRRGLGHQGKAPVAAQAEAFGRWSGDPDTGALYAELHTYLPEDLLTLLDRTTMAVSVEGRVPFLDHRLVEAALAVPPAIRTPGGRQKALERAMAAPFLPESVLEAPKQGFASPVPAWFKGDLSSQVRRLLTRKSSLDRGWWTAQGVEALMRQPERHAFRLYALTMLELTVRQICENPTSVPPSGELADFADAC